MTEIKGQKTPLRILNSLIGDENIPPALLFHGPPGVGKFLSALNFSIELIGSEGRILKNTHPDNLVIFPEFEGMDRTEILKKRLDGEYHELRYQKGSISIDKVREIQDYAYITPMESQWRIVTIVQADRLTKEGANSFLKILEEPPEKVIFILITTNWKLIPETIRSRTMNIKFHPLDKNIQKQILKGERLEYFGRGIEETRLLNSEKEMEEEVEDLFFKKDVKSRIAIWKEDLGKKWKLDILLLLLKNLVENKYREGELPMDRAWKDLQYIRKAYKYYHSNVGEKHILFYLLLEI